MTEPEPATALDVLKMLWEEYRYRHELCWRVPLQTTVAAVVLSTLPYAQCHAVFGYVQDKTLLVPALGIVLTIFAITMMEHELNRLLPVRDRYRELQPLVSVFPKSERHLFLPSCPHLFESISGPSVVCKWSTCSS